MRTYFSSLSWLFFLLSSFIYSPQYGRPQERESFLCLRNMRTGKMSLKDTAKCVQRASYNSWIVVRASIPISKPPLRSHRSMSKHGIHVPKLDKNYSRQFPKNKISVWVVSSGHSCAVCFLLIEKRYFWTSQWQKSLFWAHMEYTFVLTEQVKSISDVLINRIRNVFVK